MTVKQRLAKLLNVKSIMTLSLTGVFCYLAIVGTIAATQFIVIFTTIVGFYFGTQADKTKNEKKGDDDND